MIACHPANSFACTNLASDLTSRYDHTATFVPALLQTVPALIGAFVGAPVLARELETGTFRFAWTKSFGRWRWAMARLVPLAIVVTAAAGLFSQVFSWYYRPLIADGQSGPLSPLVFDLRGIAFAAWTLAAFTIGALAGILIRRVLPAIVAALAVYVSLACAAGLFLRQHYLTPGVTNQLNLPAPAWIMNQWWTKAGAFAFGGRPSMELLQQDCPPAAIGPGKPLVTDDRRLPRPARLHAMDQIPAGQPVLAIPVDRSGLASGTLGHPHRARRLADPRPSHLTSHSCSELSSHVTAAPRNGRRFDLGDPPETREHSRQ